MASQDVVTLVLAAGKGSRMGGPKALLMLDGSTLAESHARSASNVVIVLRAEVAAQLSLPAHVRVVVSEEDDALGPAGSIRAAVRAGALEEASVVVVTPVDRAPASTDSVAALIRGLQGHDASRPAHGHPIAIRADALRRNYARDARPLRDIVAALATRVLALPECAARDLDTPDDVITRTGHPPRFLAQK